jgi:hypothetical protein
MDPAHLRGTTASVLNLKGVVLMRTRNVIALSAIFISLLPALSYAGNFVIDDETDSPAVASLGMLCSNIIGDGGVIKPGKKITIEEQNINAICPRTCVIDVFMGTNCASASIATVHVDNSARDEKDKKGIVSIVNHQNSGGYVLDGKGYSAMITRKTGILDWFKWNTRNS